MYYYYYIVYCISGLFNWRPAGQIRPPGDIYWPFEYNVKKLHFKKKFKMFFFFVFFNTFLGEGVKLIDRGEDIAWKLWRARVLNPPTSYCSDNSCHLLRLCARPRGSRCPSLQACAPSTVSRQWYDSSNLVSIVGYQNVSFYVKKTKGWHRKPAIQQRVIAHISSHFFPGPLLWIIFINQPPFQTNWIALLYIVNVR